jgi:hypothetical protein
MKNPKNARAVSAPPAPPRRFRLRKLEERIAPRKPKGGAASSLNIY